MRLHLQRANLRRVYEEQVEPIFTAVVAEAEGEQGSGDASSGISLDDFLWANSIFWSRALTLPLTPCLSAYANDAAADAGSPTGAAAAAVVHADADPAADSANTADAADTPPASSPSHSLEAIVPGVDFCNHSLLPCARWEVLTASQLTSSPGKNGSGEEHKRRAEIERRGDGAVAGSASGSQPLQQMANSDAVCLLQVVPPVGGNEVTISYGEKGNEELLFLYGFAIPNNPHQRLMLNYPPAHLQEDPRADTKLQLLAVQDLSLQWIIPRPSKFPINARQKQGHDEKQGQQVLQQKQAQHGEQNEEEGEEEQESERGDVFPSSMMAALRVLSLTEPQVEAATSALLERKAAAGAGPLSPADAREAVRGAAGGDAEALMLSHQRQNQPSPPITSLPFFPASQRKAAAGAGPLSPADAREASGVRDGESWDRSDESRFRFGVLRAIFETSQKCSKGHAWWMAQGPLKKTLHGSLHMHRLMSRIHLTSSPLPAHRLDNMLQSTGTAEEDSAWLTAHAQIDGHDKSMRHKALCVVYRLGQKLLAQELLTRVGSCI
ncbi:unnamed protein product [Closterium sp. Yama58-4]|nr:unnamed protein product [Closterium sp. Yama58-4]